MDIVHLLIWPFLACLVLTGIFAYFGLHVVEREVIFVDLSLAQVTALGATVACLAGYDLHGRAAGVFSLGFAMLAAAVFTLTRARASRVPQEAVIGIVYAVSAAASILVMDRLPEGAEHIKHLLVGSLLAVRPPDVGKLALICCLIGLLHWRLRKPFLAISMDHDEAVRQGYHVRAWDFLFYATFGIVVTSSVPIAGVLLVFSYLIVPSVTAMLFSDRIGARLAIGWSMGALSSLIGIYASYQFDAPTGAAVICTFGAVLALAALLRSAFQRAGFC